MLGSSKFWKLLQRGTSLWPYSSGSTCHGGSHREGCKEDILRGNSSSMGSSKSHRQNHKSQARFVSGDLGWSQLASHQLLTKLGVRFRRECEMNPAAGRMNGERNEVGFFRCRFLHREESMPFISLATASFEGLVVKTYSHSSMK